MLKIAKQQSQNKIYQNNKQDT